MKRRGLALILVVGVLGVLAVLGSAFAVLSRLERRAATLRVSATQALLLARSGMEDAQARLDQGQDPVYAGEDFNDNKVLDAGPETDGQVYQPTTLNRDDCPVTQALRPSFFKAVGLNPRLVPVGTRMRGCSGALSTGTWAIKATPAGGFHVNGGRPDLVSNPAATSNLNTSLRRMFGILAEAIDREPDGLTPRGILTRTDGENLIVKRPVTKRGWESFEQIRLLALGGSQAKLDALKDYLVLNAWTDKKVVGYSIDRKSGVTPFPQRDPPPAWPSGNKGFRSQPTLRMGQWISWPTFLSPLLNPTRMCPELERIPFFDVLTWTPGGSVVGRAPVDLAWARTKRPALIALTANLKGFCWREWTGDILNSASVLGILQPTEVSLDWTAPSDDCRTVTREILSSTSELRTWEQFNAFCDALPLTGDSGLGQGKKDLLKANFNPNTDANKFHPEEALYRSLDKSDIRVGSTEFHLGAPRSWRISACGRSSGVAPASRTLSAESAPDRLFRLTSQSEFVAGNLGNPDVAGDESGFRAYGDSPYLTVSNGTSKTFGHRLLDPVPIQGFGLQTYPEIPSMWSSGTYPTPPVWDGQLKLATVETADNEYAQGGQMTFLARWDRTWDASVGGDRNALLDAYSGTPGQSIWPDLNVDSAVANLFPDGGYLERNWVDGNGALPSDLIGSVPGYRSAGNIPPYNGTISYWFKPACDSAKYTGPYASTTVHDYFDTHIHFNNTRWKMPAVNGICHWAVFRITAGEFNQGTFTTDVGTPRGFTFNWECEIDAYPIGNRNYQAQITPVRDIRPRWYLLTAFWDMVTPQTGPTSDLSSRIWVDRGLVFPDRNSPVSYAQLFNDDIHMSGGPFVDFTAQTPMPSWYNIHYTDPENQDAYFFLGHRGTIPQVTDRPLLGRGGPEATFDEFAIYDFGLSTGSGISRSQNLATQRFKDGRFYKESDYRPGGLRDPLGNARLPAGRTAGEWFSAPVDLGDAKVRALAWTQIVPKGLKGLAPVPNGTPKEDYDNPPSNVPDGKDGRVALELAHKGVQVPAVGGTDYALDGSGRKLDALYTDPRGQTLLPGDRFPRRLSAPFRLHAVFQPRLDDPDNKAILDPLALDDVTVTYRPLNSSGFSTWREGE